MMVLSREVPINSIIWCVVGALTGAAASLVMRGGRIAMIENVLVGVFGAFIGGDFLVAMFSSAAADDKQFHVGSLGMAVIGAVLMLVALRLMRGAVGPLLPGRRKGGQRRS